MKIYKAALLLFTLIIGCKEKEKLSSDYEPESQKSFYYDHQIVFRNKISDTKNDVAVNKVLNDYKQFLETYGEQNNKIDWWVAQVEEITPLDKEGQRTKLILGDVFQNKFEALLEGETNNQIYDIAVNDYVIFKGSFNGPFRISLDDIKVFLTTTFDMQIDSIKVIPVKN